MTMYMMLDYMCQEKKEREDLPALKTAFDATVRRFDDYIEKPGGITVTKNNTDDTSINRTEITTKKMRSKTILWTF